MAASRIIDNPFAKKSTKFPSIANHPLFTALAFNTNSSKKQTRTKSVRVPLLKFILFIHSLTIIDRKSISPIVF